MLGAFLICGGIIYFGAKLPPISTAPRVQTAIRPEPAPPEPPKEILPPPALEKDNVPSGPPMPALAPSPRQEVRLVPIPSYTAVDAWRKGGALLGRRVRLTGEAEVKRSVNGVYAVFRLPTGRRIATVSVANEDAGPLREIETGQSKALDVNLETTIKGSAEELLLADAEFLALDAPQGFAALEEPPASLQLPPARPASPQLPPGPVQVPPREPSPVYVLVEDSSGFRSAPRPVEKPVHVQGYYRSNGTFVRSHCLIVCWQGPVHGCRNGAGGRWMAWKAECNPLRRSKLVCS